MEKVLRFKYATWNIRGLGEKGDELDNTLNENNIKISVIIENKRNCKELKRLNLANPNEVTLVWVPGHHGILGKEMAVMLARQASAMPLLGPEHSLGITKYLIRETIKSWTENQHLSTWKIVPDCRHGKLFIGRPCKKRALMCAIPVVRVNN